MFRSGASKRQQTGADFDLDELYSLSSSNSGPGTTGATTSSRAGYDSDNNDLYGSSTTFEYDSFESSSKSDFFRGLQRDVRLWVQGADRKILLGMAASLFLIVGAFFYSVFSNTDPSMKFFERGPGAKYLDPIMHQKASVMTMGPPFDRLRDVVWDQPYRRSDTIVYWQTPKAGENIIPKMLSDCFQLTLATNTGRSYDDENELRIHKIDGQSFVNVDTTTVDGIERAEELDLITSGMVDVMISPHVRKISDIFSWENQGRMFAFFRHPIERELDRGKSGDFRDNYMTRLIINKWEGELNFVDLGNAKKVIREKCVVGLLDEFKMESLERIVKYLGWEGSQLCVEEYAAKMPDEEYGDLVDGTDENWQLLHKYNVYDVQLYEYARTTFRAQRQTLVPLAKQFELFGDPEGERENP